MPASPAAWLITTARRKVIDRLRRQQTLTRKIAELGQTISVEEKSSAGDDRSELDAWPDDRLRLIFTSCHPALALEAQVALTLRLIGGLTTEAIARAFIVPEHTMAKRLVRAKAKIRNARIPYAIPTSDELPNRLEGVLRVVYLIFNEGYASADAGSLTRPELCTEAIRLGRLLGLLLPKDPEVKGLISLMLLNHSHRHARVDVAGNLLVLEEQDRSLWDRALIEEGIGILDEAMAIKRSGPYQIEAAIAALHAQAPTARDVDWPQIAALYGRLLRVRTNPVIALNYAAAQGMAYGAAEGLHLIGEIEREHRLERYHYLHAARADLERRAGRYGEAALSYERAIKLCANPVESRYLERRLKEVRDACTGT